MSTHTHTAKNEVKTYVAILATLLVLTVITVVAAGFDFGSGNVVIALTIATIKASLVALFFMHLLHDKPINGIIMVSGFIFLGLFLGFCFTDVSSRAPLEPTNLKPAVVVPAKAPEQAAAAPK